MKYFQMSPLFMTRVKNLQLPQLSTIQSYVSKLEGHNQKFETVQDKIKDINFLLETSDRLEINQVSNAFTDLIVHVESRYLLLKKQEPAPPSTADASTSSLPHYNFNPLPRIPIPQFAGNIDEWPEFHRLTSQGFMTLMNYLTFRNFNT